MCYFCDTSKADGAHEVTKQIRGNYTQETLYDGQTLAHAVCCYIQIAQCSNSKQGT